MDNEKEMIVDSTGKILSEIQDKKFEIVTPAEHREDDKTGWTFSIKTDGGEFVCFAGFICDEKYEDKFVFEILEGADTEKFDFMEWDKDESDNLVIESKSFKKFLNSKNEVRTKDLSKWITEYCKTVTAFFKIGNTDYKKVGFLRRLFMLEMPFLLIMSALAGTA